MADDLLGVLKPKRVWGAPTKSASDVITQVAANDSSVNLVDLSNSAIFQMRSDELMVSLSDALRRNTNVRELVLVNCGISDRGCEALGMALQENNSLVVINLEKNNISGAGASALAAGLSKNREVRELNLMNQAQGRWTDRCLDDFMEMFESNVTLLKIVWRLESRKSFAINKNITRNNEIDRRIKANISYDDLLPSGLKGHVLGAASTHVSSSTPQRPDVVRGEFAAQRGGGAGQVGSAAKAYQMLMAADGGEAGAEEMQPKNSPPKVNKVLTRWPPAVAAASMT